MGLICSGIPSFSSLSWATLSNRHFIIWVFAFLKYSSTLMTVLPSL